MLKDVLFSLNFLKEKGFPVVKSAQVKNLQEAQRKACEFNYPVFIKIISDKIIHKAKQGFVKECVNEQDLKDKFTKMEKAAKLEDENAGILIQEHSHGTELILGLKQDEVFGKVILVGSGGTLTELIKDISFRACPINKQDAKEMLEELRIFNHLKSKEGMLEDLIVKTSQLPVKELDINPVMVNTQSVHVVDARLIL
jgi:succinyl-CoA synthetase beta subunit